MKVNHEKSKILINETNNLLKEQAAATANYRKQKEELETNTTYSQSYQQEQIEKLRESYIANLIQTKEKAIAKLNELLVVEEEQESILELDIPEFSNTLALIKATKGVLEDDTIAGIVSNFTGHYQILKSLKQIFSDYDKDITEILKDKSYFESANLLISNIIVNVQNIDHSYVASIKNIRDVMRSLINFGETRGLVFSESEKDFGEAKEIVLEALDMEEYIIARKAMGLME